MNDFFGKAYEVCCSLFNSDQLIALMGKPEFTVVAFVVLTAIVFTETGLLVGFFLPGDSLLVTAGLVAYLSGWNVPLLLGLLCAAAIVGDTVGYNIGFRAGPKIFTREKSLLFNRDHLFKAQEFYDKHGGKTIVIARFMPIIRTFAPVVAGVGKMDYRRFLFFNVIGGIGWVCSMILLGYALTPVLNPMLKPIFGPDFEVIKHVEKVIIAVVLLSISPGIYHYVRMKLAGKHNEAAVEVR